MNKKIILGILSSDSYNDKDLFLKQIANHGFITHSINSKILEMAKYLLKHEEDTKITADNIAKIRKRGYIVNKLYWINLLLASISDDEEYIIIDDLWEEDLYEGYITLVVSDPILIPNVSFIKFPQKLSIMDIKLWIKEIERKLYNTK